VGVTPLIRKIAEKLDAKKTIATVLEPMVLALILIVSTAAMVDGSFNPFIYFRF
jgi:alginate O-acetyltransferase complex protein AlgI